jgi:hypothetical protein
MKKWPEGSGLRLIPDPAWFGQICRTLAVATLFVTSTAATECLAWQETSPTDEAPEEIFGELESVPQPRSPESMDEPEMAELFRRLKELRHELQSEQHDRRDESQTQESESRPGADMISLMTRELESSRQVDELGARIEKLRELYQQKKTAAEAAVKSHDGHGVDGAGATGMESHSGASGTSIEDIVLHNSEQQSLPEGSPQTMLDAPSDQVLLAESLYYTGEINLALDVLTRIRAEKPDQVDIPWIDYQISGCLRRLGEIDKSSKILRSLAEISPMDPVCDQSKWLLDHSERRVKLQQELEIFASFLGTATSQEGNASESPAKQR